MAQEPAWRNRTKTKRGVGKTSRTIKNTFLIFCEGESTEPNYFKAFPTSTETKVETIGTGRTKTALVKHALEELKKRNKTDKDPDRQVWVVFDFDINLKISDQKQDFNNAIQMAESKKMKVAYSNDCFELWLYLHFEYNETPMHRTQLYELLSKKLNLDYEESGKTKKEAAKLYELLLPLQPKAIANAKKLFDKKLEDGTERENPSTQIFKLVEQLNLCLR